MKRIIGKSFLWIFLVGFIALGFAWAISYILIPEEVVVYSGSKSEISLGLPIFTMEDLNNEYINVSSSSIKAIKEGTNETSVSLLGVVPLRKVKVHVIPKDSVYVSGKLVGLRMKIGELLVAGVENINTEYGNVNPAREADIKPGDYIVKANGEQVQTVDQLTNVVKADSDEKINLTIRRNNEYITKEITCAHSIEDDKARLGLWLRDGISGLGTLTFVQGDFAEYGCLGHAITDVDTGVMLPVSDGRLYSAEVVSSERGEVGDPGEIKGCIDERHIVGNVRLNTEQGVFGDLSLNDSQSTKDELSLKNYVPSSRYDVHDGKAFILCETKDEGVKQYEVNIENVNVGTMFGTKGFEVCVTDKELLDSTGGIIQGMSGSPVIQEGKIIGAVTHVMVNNPTCGYGIFIDSMLEKSLSIKK